MSTIKALSTGVVTTNLQDLKVSSTSRADNIDQADIKGANLKIIQIVNEDKDLKNILNAINIGLEDERSSMGQISKSIQDLFEKLSARSDSLFSGWQFAGEDNFSSELMAKLNVIVWYKYFEATFGTAPFKFEELSESTQRMLAKYPDIKLVKFDTIHSFESKRFFNDIRSSL